MNTREQRILLWLTSAAICWRWFTSLRTPMPGIDACTHLWLAQELARGDFAALTSGGWLPAWGLCLSPLVACGVAPFFAAQIVAAVVGGLTVWPVAAAAHRLREGAAVPAGVLAVLNAGTVLGAGAGTATSLTSLLVACGVLAIATRRWVFALLLMLSAASMGADLLRADSGPAFVQLLVAGGPALLLLPLALREPRPRAAVWLWVVLTLVMATALVGACWRALLPSWSPLISVLVAVGLARLSTLQRDLVLCAIVAVEFATAWHQVEPNRVAAENWLGRHLARQYHQQERLASDLPRVLWAYGERPQRIGPAELLLAARRPETVLLVLGSSGAERATRAAALAAEFSRCQLPNDLVDAVDAIGAQVFVRRR